MPKYVTIKINSQKITAPVGSEVEAEGVKVKIPEEIYNEDNFDYVAYDLGNTKPFHGTSSLPEYNDIENPFLDDSLVRRRKKRRS